jgi:UDP-2,3-diacylglucosamine pyrophosphatase LpxH
VSATREEILIVSDLHLDVAALERGAAFASFVRASSAAGRRRLVLLGDSLDLPTHAPGPKADAADRWSAAGTEAVGRIGDAQAEAFDALIAFLAAGGRLELVPGNHDVALQVPAVRAALLDRLGDAADGVGWHPWILHLPGLLWAEHGSQHHDLHSVPNWLVPAPNRSTWGLPPGRAIEALARALQDRRPTRQLVAAVAALAADATSATLARRMLAPGRRVYRATELPSSAAAMALPPSVLAAVDRLSETDAWSIARRLVRQFLARDVATPASYLGPAAGRIHATLAAAGYDVPVYAFGHTHRPALLPIGPSAPEAWYANAGSWAPLRPASLRARVGPHRYPFLKMSVFEQGAPAIELNLWNAALTRVEPFPD